MCFKEKSFDLVFNEGVVEHWLQREERIEVIREMVRVTRINGVVGIVVPNGKHPLMGFWKATGYPGYFDKIVPAWTRYNNATLKNEMETAGLSVVEVDGIDPYKSINFWPRHKLLNLFAIACDKFLPHPKWLRRKWGIHLVAKGFRNS
jgi:SAM-dependent methyltransferase